jgi:hypothetical protein
MPLEVADCFLWNSPKFLSKKTIFPNSLPFLFLSESFPNPPHLRARPGKTSKLFFGYSIVKHLKNEKGATTFESLKRNLRYRS